MSEEIKYTERGRAVVVVGQSKGFPVVRSVRTERVSIYRGELLDTMPAIEDDRYYKELVRARAELLTEIKNLEQQKVSMHKDMADLEACAPAVARVLQCHRQEFKYIVQWNDYSAPKVLEWGDPGMKSGTERWDHDMKLLVLYGSSKGDLQFKLHHYSDGSGGCAYSAMPFATHSAAWEFAVQICQKMLGQAIEKTTSKSHNDSALATPIAACDEYKVPVPDELRDRSKAYIRAGLEHTIAKMKTDLQRAEQELADKTR